MEGAQVRESDSRVINIESVLFSNSFPTEDIEEICQVQKPLPVFSSFSKQSSHFNVSNKKSTIDNSFQLFF